VLNRNLATDGDRRPWVLPEGVRRWSSPLDPSRAFGAGADRFYKITQGRGAPRRQDLRGEFELLRRCRGVAGVPEALELIGGGDFQVLVLRKVPGEPLSRLELPWPRFARVMLRVFAIVWALARRGIRHNDLRPENVMVAPDGTVNLVDFDQASAGGLAECLLAGLGVKLSGAPVCHGLLAPLRERLQARLSPRLIRALRGRPLRIARRRVPPLSRCRRPPARSFGPCTKPGASPRPRRPARRGRISPITSWSSLASGFRASGPGRRAGSGCAT
jgi:Phosphotransferase enzyme family